MDWSLIGLAITWLAAVVHLGGVRFGGAYHNAWTVLKLVLIIVFIVAGFVVGDAQSVRSRRAPPTSAISALRRSPSALCL